MILNRIGREMRLSGSKKKKINSETKLTEHTHGRITSAQRQTCWIRYNGSVQNGILTSYDYLCSVLCAKLVKLLKYCIPQCNVTWLSISN